MESFKFLYLDACQFLKIPQCSKVLSRIEETGNSSTLNLSGLQFTNLTCMAVGQAFAKDIHIKQLDCINCIFSDEGFMHLLSGIEKNKFLTSLNFKGNNIRSLGSEALGKFFRHNNHLQNLYLEWNGLGIFPEKFALFCEGLCSNNSLKVLGLQSNQLNSLCAQSLSDMLLKNSSLQNLDIRWNNIGLAGGRAILKSLKQNVSLLQLNTNGNDITGDILEAINIATLSSSQRFITKNEQVDKIKYLASKLQAKEEERQSQVKSLMEQIEKVDNEASKTERWNTKKLSDVKADLAEKDKDCDNLTNVVRKLESELWTLTVQKDQIFDSFNALEIKHKELQEEYHISLENKAKDRDESEQKLLNQIRLSKVENTSLNQQVHDMKSDLTIAEEQNLKLKESYKKLETISEHQKDILNQQVALLSQKHSQEIKEKELLHAKELSALKDEFAEEKKCLGHKISLLESQNSNLEQKLKEKNAQIFSERSQNEEKFLQLEKKLKTDHENTRQKLEERIVMLEEANREQYDRSQADLQLMYQLKTDVTALDLNLAEQDHEIDRLQKLLSEKDAEIKACETKVRLEVKEQLEELKDSRETIKNQNKEYSLLKDSIKEIELQFKKELDFMAKTNNGLKTELQLQQEKTQEIVDDQNKRTKELQKAFEVYLKSGTKRNKIFSQSGDA